MCGLEWFFRPLTEAVKNNITNSSFFKTKVFWGFCFFNFRGKNIEKKLIESERKYKDIYENAPIGIFHSTFEGKLLRVNPTFAKILKYDSPEEVISVVNKTGVAECLYVNPEHRDEIINQVANYKGWHTFENTYKCKDGQTIFANVSLRSVETSSAREVEGFLVDVDEKRKFEKELSEGQQKYQELVENINDVIFHLDNEGNFIYISPVIKRVAGYEPEEVIGHSFQEFIHPDDFSSARIKLKAALSGELKPREIKIIKKDGSIAYVSSFGRPLIKEGKTEGVISVLTDISERKKAEATLLESYKYLGTINRQFTVLIDLNKILKEKDEKKAVDHIAWSGLEMFNSEISILYKYQKDREAFQLISLASKKKIKEEEKSGIFHLTVTSSKCKSKIDEINIQKIKNIEECFKKTKLSRFKLKHKIKNFYTLPITNKRELRGVLILGFLEKKEVLINNNSFHEIFSKYISFILSDIGVV